MSDTTTHLEVFLDVTALAYEHEPRSEALLRAYFAEISISTIATAIMRSKVSDHFRRGGLITTQPNSEVLHYQVMDGFSLHTNVLDSFFQISSIENGSIRAKSKMSTVGFLSFLAGVLGEDIVQDSKFGSSVSNQAVAVIDAVTDSLAEVLEKMTVKFQREEEGPNTRFSTELYALPRREEEMVVLLGPKLKRKQKK